MSVWQTLVEKESTSPEFTWSGAIGPTVHKFLNSDKLGKQMKIVYL